MTEHPDLEPRPRPPGAPTSSLGDFLRHVAEECDSGEPGPSTAQIVQTVRDGRDSGDLADAVRQAVAELDAEHRPMDQRRRNGDPIGCVICWPRDGSWPCVSHMITDDLRTAVNGLQ